MKSASVDRRTPSLLPRTSRSRRQSVTAIGVAAVVALSLGACGGDDDAGDDDAATTEITDTTVPPSATLSPTTDPPTTTTLPPTTTTLPPLDLVTEGASVVVANASGIDGAAGRMTDALAEAGFTTGTATNSSEGPLATSKVYYDPANENARAVADSLREALGGGDIEVLELAVPAPTDDGEIGDASILLAMGNDTADQTLDELQGRVPPEDTGEATAEETTGEETTGEATAEETTGEATTGEATADG